MQLGGNIDVRFCGEKVDLTERLPPVTEKHWPFLIEIGYPADDDDLRLVQRIIRLLPITLIGDEGTGIEVLLTRFSSVDDHQRFGLQLVCIKGKVKTFFMPFRTGTLVNFTVLPAGSIHLSIPELITVELYLNPTNLQGVHKLTAP